jgi:hypothetical protein
MDRLAGRNGTQGEIESRWLRRPPHASRGYGSLIVKSRGLHTNARDRTDGTVGGANTPGHAVGKLVEIALGAGLGPARLRPCNPLICKGFVFGVHCSILRRPTTPASARYGYPDPEPAGWSALQRPAGADCILSKRASVCSGALRFLEDQAGNHLRCRIDGGVQHSLRNLTQDDRRWSQVLVNAGYSAVFPTGLGYRAGAARASLLDSTKSS